MSVRFLARRVYLGLAVVLVSARPGMALGVERRTLTRWRLWWCEKFPLTPLWHADCVRFMPPVPEADLPGELITRFGDPASKALMRLRVWLSPVTVGGLPRSS